MVEQFIVNLLVSKIKSGAINPKTGQPFQLDDIKIIDYRDAVQQALTAQ